MKLYRKDTSTEYLRDPYQKTAKIINYSAAGIGLVLLIGLIVPLSSFLNIDPAKCVKCQENGWIWIAAFISGIFVLYYLSHVILASVYVVILLLKKQLTLKESFVYVFLTKHPDRWFK